MTREEAIRWIKQHRDIHKLYESRTVKISETLDMAIKALEQEPCEDAVSRADVIDLIEASDLDLAYRTDNQAVCSFVKMIPAVTPKRKTGKWIVHYECPKCGEITKNLTEYCPFCSADMRGESERGKQE